MGELPRDDRAFDTIRRWARYEPMDAREILAALNSWVRSLGGEVYLQDIAKEMRELAEMYLYDGDSDQPLPGCEQLYALADRVAAGSVVQSGDTEGTTT